MTEPPDDAGVDRPDSAPEDTRDGSRRGLATGVILWASFLAACFATLVFFGYFDPPYLLHDDNPPAWLADRMTGYAVGFFFFWIVALVAAYLTAFLLSQRSASDGE